MADLNDEIKLSVDASGVETGVNSAKRSIDSLGKTVTDAGKKGGDGFTQLGRAVGNAGKEVDRTTKNLISSIQRQTAAAEAGGTATRQYQESIARLRGANMDALKPYLDQLDQAKKKTDEASKATEKFSGAAQSLGSIIGGLAAGFVAGFSLQKFISETISAEQEQADLVAALKSTGEAAGWTRDQLNRMADGIAKSTNFSSGEVTKAQTRLLSYTGIVGDQVPRAMKAAADMAARMGMDLSSAAEQVGRALDVPSQGMSALTRQGFRFTEEQKAVVERLEETGRAAEAQGIILEALETSYGGAASAARDTFGGSLKALQKTIDDLLTGEGGSVTGMREGIESLNTALSSDGTRAAFQTFIGWIATTAAEAASATANLITFMGIVFGTDQIANNTRSSKRLADQSKWLMKEYEEISELAKLDPGNLAYTKRAEELRAKLAEVSKEMASVSDNLKGVAGIPGAAKPDIPTLAGAPLPTVRTKEAEKAAKDAAKAAEQARKEFDALFNSLTNKEVGLDAKFDDQLKTLYEGFKKGRISADEYRGAVTALINQQPFVKAAIDEEAKATRERVKAWEADVKAQEAVLKARQSATKSVEDSLQKARDEEKAHALAASTGITLAEAIERLSLARAEENYQKEVGAGADGATLLALQREIEARKGLITVMQDRGVREANAKAAEEAAKEWEKTSQLIGDTLADYIMGGGKDAAQYLKRLFATLVLRPVVEWGVSGLMGAVGLGGNSGGALGAASNASSLYSLFSGGAGNMGAISGALGGSMSWANAAGSIYANTTGTGISGLLATNGAYGTAGSSALGGAGAAAGVLALPLIAGLIAGYLDNGDRMSGAAYASSGGDPLSQVLGGSLTPDAISGAIPDRQAMLARLRALGAPDEYLSGNDNQLYRMLLLSGGLRYENADQLNASRDEWTQAPNWREWSNNFSGLSDFYRGAGYANPEQMGWWDVENRPDRNWDSTYIDPQIVATSRQLSESILGPLEAITQSLGGSDAFRVATGFGSNPQDRNPIWGGLNVQRNGEDILGFGMREYQSSGDYIRDIYSETLNAFTQLDLPNWARTQVESAQTALDGLSGDNMGEQAAQIYQQASSEIANTISTISKLISIVPELGGATQDAVYNIGQALGGLDQFTSLYSGFVQNFYTESERFKYIRDGINQTLAAVDIGVTVETSRDQFRALVEAQDLTTESGQQAFAALMQVSGAFAEITPVAEVAADSLSVLEQQIQQIGESIGSDFAAVLTDGLLGNLTGADLGGAMADVVIGGVYNALASNVGQQISDMMITTVVNPLLTAAMTGASVSEAVSQAAIDSMVANAQAAAQALNAVLSSPEFQEAIKGIDGAIRSISVATPSRPYYSSYQPVRQVESYSKAVSDSAKEAARAAEEINRAWTSISDTLIDEVRRIRGELADAGDQSMAYWQSQFAIDTAAARSGDEEAAKRLTDISRSLLDSAGREAASMLELQQARAWVAQSLQDTAGYAQAIAGGALTSTAKPKTSFVAPVPVMTQAPIVLSADPGLLAEVKELRRVVEEQTRLISAQQLEGLRIERRREALGTATYTVAAP